MNIQMVYKNIDKSQAIEAYAKEKFSKLGKFFKGEVEARVTVAKENKTQKLDVLIPFNGLVVRAEDKDDDIYKSIDAVEEKLERQLRKYKTRIEKRHTKDSIKSPVFNEEAFRHNKEVAIEVHHNENEPEIVKVKKITAKPMSDEEAILQMQLLGHDFFVYRNLDDETAVLYRRNDGNLGKMITQPE